MAEIKVEEHAQLRSIATGIDPVLVREVVEELQREEREIRERLRQLDGPTEAMRAISAIRGLREHADELRVALRHGDLEDQRKIFARTIRSVTWLPEEERLEMRLVLPQLDEEAVRAARVWILYVPGVGFELRLRA